MKSPIMTLPRLYLSVLQACPYTTQVTVGVSFMVGSRGGDEDTCFVQ